jgi:hypothetical protein
MLGLGHSTAVCALRAACIRLRHCALQLCLCSAMGMRSAVAKAPCKLLHIGACLGSPSPAMPQFMCGHLANWGGHSWP